MKKHTILILLTTASLILSGCSAFSPKEPKPEYKEAFQEMCEILDKRYEQKIKVLDLPLTKEEYETKKAEVEKKLPDVSTEAELYCLLQDFIADFQDIHTVIYTDYQNTSDEYYFLPYSFVSYEGEFYIDRCPNNNADYLGWKLCGINNNSMEEIREKMSGFVSRENEYSLITNMEKALASADVLKYLDIIENENGEIKLTLENPDTKKEEKVLCEALTYQQRAESDSVKLSREVSPVTAPEKIYSSAQLEDGVYFIQINQHIEDKEYPETQFRDQVLADLELYKPEKIILDLRYNGGGYTDMFGSLKKGIEKWVEQSETEVYTLISKRTASAAVMMAVESQSMFDSILVGEPTCQKPNFNAHADSQKLGNTSLMFQYSTLYIRTIDGGDNLETLEPDIFVPRTMEDWKNGVDAAVDAVLKL